MATMFADVSWDWHLGRTSWSQKVSRICEAQSCPGSPHRCDPRLGRRAGRCAWLIREEMHVIVSKERPREARKEELDGEDPGRVLELAVVRRRELVGS